MKRKPPLTKELIGHLFDINTNTGEFYWKNPTNWAIKKGKKAGRIWQDPKDKKHKYYKISVNGLEYNRSYLMYCHITGKWPENGMVIDHINRNPLDDRVENLRQITHQQNSFNANPTGVYKRRGKFYSTIMKSGVAHFLGWHKTFESARSAYLTARKFYFGEFA